MATHELPTLKLAVYTDATMIGGAEQSLANLISHLNAGIQVAVVGVDEEVVEWVAGQREGATTHRVPPVSNKFDLRPILAHVRSIGRIDPDILQLNLKTPWDCQYALFAGLVTRTSVIAVEQLPMPTTSRVQRLAKRIGSARLAAHVAVSRAAAREVEQFADLRPGSVSTIYTGIPDVPTSTRRRLVDGPVVGAHGRLADQKGYDVLVRALPLLPGVTAVIVGDGPERASLVDLAEELGVASQLVLPGWSEDARSYLSGFDVFALPSRYEGLPLSLVEAMLAGLPVVVSGLPAFREAIEDGETGIVVPGEDPATFARAVASLLADPTRRAEMGARARAVALERFTPAAAASAYEELYASVRRDASPPSTEPRR